MFGECILRIARTGRLHKQTAQPQLTRGLTFGQEDGGKGQAQFFDFAIRAQGHRGDSRSWTRLLSSLLLLFLFNNIQVLQSF